VKDFNNGRQESDKKASSVRPVTDTEANNKMLMIFTYDINGNLMIALDNHWVPAS
jgi:hypothetical protein